MNVSALFDFWYIEVLRYRLILPYSRYLCMDTDKGFYQKGSSDAYFIFYSYICHTMYVEEDPGRKQLIKQHYTFRENRGVFLILLFVHNFFHYCNSTSTRRVTLSWVARVWFYFIDNILIFVFSFLKYWNWKSRTSWKRTITI